VRCRARRPDNTKSNLHWFELQRPSSKGTKSLFHVIKATINLAHPDRALHRSLSCDELTHNRQRLDSTHLSIYVRAQVLVFRVFQNTQHRISLPLSTVHGLRCQNTYSTNVVRLFLSGENWVLCDRETQYFKAVSSSVQEWCGSTSKILSWVCTQFVSKSLLTLTVRRLFQAKMLHWNGTTEQNEPRQSSRGKSLTGKEIWWAMKIESQHGVCKRWKTMGREPAEQEVHKHWDHVTGAWARKQISNLTKTTNWRQLWPEYGNGSTTRYRDGLREIQQEL